MILMRDSRLCSALIGASAFAALLSASPSMAETCGNNLVEIGEECDGTSAVKCVGGACRAPGDPAGECTCELGVAVLVDPPLAGDLVIQRFLELILPTSSAGTATAYRVTLSSLYHPSDPQPVNQPDYTGWEGEVRYLNLYRDMNGDSVTDCVNSRAFVTTFKCARVGCEPEFADWGALFGGASVFVYGNAILPDSVYSVAHIPAICEGNEANCVHASPEVEVTTARYGNSNADVDSLTNVTDVVATVDVLKDKFGAAMKYRIWVRNKDPNGSPGVTSVVMVVDAVRLVPHVLGFDQCP